MIAEIITIGDEILIGQVIDSNSAFMGSELNKIGIDVRQIISVQDNKEHIIEALDQAKSKVDVVLITGGLGPTKDDITKHTFCSYFDDTLVMNDQVFENIKRLFEKYVNSPINDLNRKQALVPKTCKVLMNEYGTAPGMWMEKDDTIFVSMPGVPYEMKNLMKDKVLPALQKRFNSNYILHKTVLTYGMGESAIAEKIEKWEDALPPYINLAYLPSFGRVRLRLSARGKDEEALIASLKEELDKLHELIGDIIVGYEDDGSLEEQIVDLLKKRNQKLAFAESCTGGKLSQMITSFPGVSACFNGGVVTYATQSKIDVLGVSKELIDAYSVTSHEVAKAMAKGAQEKFEADYTIATTGNAGPEKGDGDVSVGTVFIAIATPETVFSERFEFSNLRERTIGKTVNKSFEMLLKILKKSS